MNIPSKALITALDLNLVLDKDPGLLKEIATSYRQLPACPAGTRNSLHLVAHRCHSATVKSSHRGPAGGICSEEVV